MELTAKRQPGALTAVLLAALVLTACGGRPAGSGVEAARQPRRQIDSSTSGSIAGSVKFRGTPPKLAAIQMDEDPACVAQHRSPVFAEDGAVNANGTLPNVFVYVKRGAEDYTFPSPAPPVTLDQKGCMYQPHVLGIRVGQTLRIVSNDATTHNIHAMARENREWNESQLPGAAPLDKVFTQPEVMIPVKCNEHPWMKAYVGVVANPFFAVTGRDGSYTLEGLPPGTYTVEAWSAAFGIEDRAVIVEPNSAVILDLAFEAGGSS